MTELVNYKIPCPLWLRILKIFPSGNFMSHTFTCFLSWSTLNILAYLFRQKYLVLGTSWSYMMTNQLTFNWCRKSYFWVQPHSISDSKLKSLSRKLHNSHIILLLHNNLRFILSLFWLVQKSSKALASQKSPNKIGLSKISICYFIKLLILTSKLI